MLRLAISISALFTGGYLHFLSDLLSGRIQGLEYTMLRPSSVNINSKVWRRPRMNSVMSVRYRGRSRLTVNFHILK